MPASHTNLLMYLITLFTNIDIKTREKLITLSRHITFRIIRYYIHDTKIKNGRVHDKTPN